MHTDRQDESQVTGHRSQMGENSERFGHGMLESSDLGPMLRREHGMVLALIDRLLVHDEADDRRTLWEELSTELRAHAEAEQEVIYRQLAKVRALRTKAARAIDEHDEICQIVEEMEDLDSSCARFQARLAKLRHTVSRHVEHEESELLPGAEKLFDLSTLDKMSEDFVLRKMDLLDGLRSKSSLG